MSLTLRKPTNVASFVCYLLVGLCLTCTRGYVVILDEHAEDPSLPGMCVPEPQRWDRIVPVGYSYPVARDCYADVTSDSASLLPPCEQVSCVKTSNRHGRTVFTLQITGCENSLYSSNHDPACDVFIPDQRLPYPLCCPQRTCYHSNSPFDQLRKKRPFIDHSIQNNPFIEPLKRQESVNQLQQRSASSPLSSVSNSTQVSSAPSVNPPQPSNQAPVVHVPLFALPPFTRFGGK